MTMRICLICGLFLLYVSGAVVCDMGDLTVDEDILMGEEMDGDEDADVTVETDETIELGADKTEVIGGDNEKEDEEEDENILKPFPYADTYILFIRPHAQEFPAGKSVRLLIGLKNDGDKELIIETVEAAFRFPQDYSFFIQNFTAYQYQQTVLPKYDSVFEYTFTPSDSLSSRNFGLTVNINYRDAEGNPYQDAVFNATVSVTEPEDGLDTETFFLYLFLLAVASLVVFLLYQLALTYGKRRLMSRQKPAAVVELGTQNNKMDVDYDWLPQTLLNDIKKSPKDKTLARQRKAKNSKGSL